MRGNTKTMTLPAVPKEKVFEKLKQRFCGLLPEKSTQSVIFRICLLMQF